MSNRGGKRKGAGRPAGTTKDNNRQSITIRLPPDLYAQVQAIPRNMKGRWIEAAIQEKLKNDYKKTQ